jgi:hypothetical protein
MDFIEHLMRSLIMRSRIVPVFWSKESSASDDIGETILDNFQIKIIFVKEDCATKL